MVQLTYYEPRNDADASDADQPAYEPPPLSQMVRHGYTMTDLNQIARMAISRHIGWGDRTTMYNTAWSAAAEHIYTAEQRPDRALVVHAAHIAVMHAAKADKKTHGRSTGPDGDNEARPHFTVFWDCICTPTSGPEQHVVERVALHQILERLTPGQVDAIIALAVHGTYQAAADALGLSYVAFKSRISHARARFLTLWHEGEEPSRPWGTDRRVSNDGHAAARANGRASKALRRRTGRPAAQVTHGKLSTYDRRGCRCGPCEDAAATRMEQRRARTGATPKRTVTAAQMREILARAAAGQTCREIAAALGFSSSTVHRHIRAGTQRTAGSMLQGSVA